MFKQENYIFEQQSDWEEIRRSKDWKIGVEANEGKCPCEQEWTVDNGMDFYDHDPPEKEINKCMEKLKAPAMPVHPCCDPCQWVLTEEWKQWRVFRHKKENRYFVACGWIRQWHCEIVESSNIN